jgi:ketosteroid isomerase-like protein
MPHILLRGFLFAGLFLAAPTLAAHETAKAPAASHSVAAPSADANSAVAVVEAFSAALKAGEVGRAATYLDPDLLVLESGGAERSRAEYLAEHAGADAEFLRDANIVPLARRADASGDMAWVASESRIEYLREGATRRVLSTETMVLRRSADGWKIVHIHWSSRSLPESGATP